jgi:hypothetical protein
MAKKDKTEKTNVNNLRSAGFSDFEASHQFTAESKLADFTRAAIQAGLTNNEIVEIGDGIYGEGKMKLNCINWYRSSDPVLNPGKERYKATGAKSIEVRTKVSDYYVGLADDEKEAFTNSLVQAIGIDELIKLAKVETLKAVVPADLFPVAVKKEKKELTDIEKLMKKQEAAEKKAAKLREELAKLEGTPSTEV